MWYDVFSLFYDRALQGHYRPFRAQAVAALRAIAVSGNDAPRSTTHQAAASRRSGGPAPLARA